MPENVSGLAGYSLQELCIVVWELYFSSHLLLKGAKNPEVSCMKLHSHIMKSVCFSSFILYMSE